MSESVPTTEEVRDDYQWGVHACGCCAERLPEDVEAFDLWLAAHDAEVAAKAVSDALESVRAERDAALADKTYWHEVATKAKDQRDAAVAALERVREIHARDTPSIGGDWCLDDHHKWPCPTIAALDGAPEPDDEPCDAEVHSWDHYRPEQIDSYWIRCTLLGKHDEHEDSHTGLKWRAGLPVEGESK